MFKKVFILYCLVLSLASHAERYEFVSTSYPPLMIPPSANKEASGIAVDVVREVMSALGHDVTINLYPWARALHAVQNGDADAIFTIYKTPERENYLDYSHEVLANQSLYLYKTERLSGFKFTGNMLTLENKKIGIIRDKSYGRKFDSFLKKYNVELTTTLEQNFKKLLTNRIDFTISNKFEGDYIASQLGITKKLIREPQPIESIPSFIAFPRAKHLQSLRNQFDAELIRIKENGIYKKILSSYGVQN